MIFKKLALKNFMSYSSAEINFSGIHTVCLVGVNGAGKSSLLDAITWTIWEEGRASTDELIKIGKDEMFCELEFYMEEELYRVYRSRSKSFKNSKGKSNLEFQIFNPKEQSWRSLTLSTTRQTQDLINKTLKMDHSTFTNSVYLRQGKADEFTTKGPIDRKQILADILGLSVYDELCEKARKKIKELEQNLSIEKGLVTTLDEKIKKEDEFLQSLERITQEVSDIEKELNETKNLLSIREKELNEKREKERQIQTLEKSKVNQGSLIQALEEQLKGLKLKQEKCNELISNKTQIENKYKKYMEIKERLELHEREKDIYNQLLQEKNLLELKLKGEINQVLKDSLSKIEKEGLALKHEKELVVLNLKKLIEKKTDITNKIETLLLHNHSEPCPLCKGEIKDKQKIIELYKSELKNCEREEEVLSGSLKLRENELSEKRNKFNEILEISKGEFQKAKGHVLTLEKETRSFIEEIIEKLNSAITSLGNLNYNQKLYDELKSGLKEKENIVILYSSLQGAESEILALEKESENLKIKITAGQNELQELTGLIIENEKAVKNISALASEADEIKQKETVLNNKLNEVRKKQIVMEQNIAQIIESKKLLEEKESLIKSIQEDKMHYEALEKAFSKNGIQVAIIESIVPEIEKEANRILSKLTENQMHVALKTQREKKSSQGLIETLDIVIGDNFGTRNYELYSGGEAFKVDFSVRLALSRLLSNRAGAKLRTLIIDEGFGSQDASGRERLIEVIRSIENEFELILVVTHIDELKESFPVQIHVLKDSEGSKIKLVA